MQSCKLSQDTTLGQPVITPAHPTQQHIAMPLYILHVYTLASESVLAGSAGIDTSTLRVSTAITPTGIPPNLEQRINTYYVSQTDTCTNVQVMPHTHGQTKRYIHCTPTNL